MSPKSQSVLSGVGSFGCSHHGFFPQSTPTVRILCIQSAICSAGCRQFRMEPLQPRLTATYCPPTVFFGEKICYRGLRCFRMQPPNFSLIDTYSRHTAVFGEPVFFPWRWRCRMRPPQLPPIAAYAWYGKRATRQSRCGAAPSTVVWQEHQLNRRARFMCHTLPILLSLKSPSLLPGVGGFAQTA